MARQGGKDRGLFELWWAQYKYIDEKGKARTCKEKAGTSKDSAQEFMRKRAALRQEVADIKYSSEWWIVYFDAEGKKRREHAGTKSQARELYEKRKTETRQGVKMPETMQQRRHGLTLAEMIERYRKTFEAKASGSDDARYARYWVADFGEVAASDLTPRDIEQWREKRLNEPPTLGGPTRLPSTKSKVKKTRAVGTVNRPVAFIKRIYNLAIRDGLVTCRNPAAQVEMLTENNERVRFLSDDEEKRLREAMTADAFRMVEIAFLTGMRMGEQFGLRRDCVDLRTGTLTIPKSKHGEKRHVHLGPRGKELFREILKEHDSEWVFPSPQDPSRPRAASGFRNVFLTGLTKAKVRDFHWHDLRHTYGSRLAMAGVDLQVIRDLMGHGSIAMTERYAHLCPSHLKRAVANL